MLSGERWGKEFLLLLYLTSCVCACMRARWGCSVQLPPQKTFSLPPSSVTLHLISLPQIFSPFQRAYVGNILCPCFYPRPVAAAPAQTAASCKSDSGLYWVQKLARFSHEIWAILSGAGYFFPRHTVLDPWPVRFGCRASGPKAL